MQDTILLPWSTSYKKIIMLEPFLVRTLQYTDHSEKHPRVLTAQCKMGTSTAQLVHWLWQGLERWGIILQFPEVRRDLDLHHNIQYHSGAPSRRVKWPGYEGDNSPPFSQYWMEPYHHTLVYLHSTTHTHNLKLIYLVNINHSNQSSQSMNLSFIYAYYILSPYVLQCTWNTI